VPAEGFEPPTYGLQNRCTTTVLSRHVCDRASSSFSQGAFYRAPPPCTQEPPPPPLPCTQEPPLPCSVVVGGCWRSAASAVFSRSDRQHERGDGSPGAAREAPHRTCGDAIDDLMPTADGVPGGVVERPCHEAALGDLDLIVGLVCHGQVGRAAV
jgi:hypothetical protein